jgi:hypothetical protein
VRTDIPLADQIVQVGHACLDAGNRFELTQNPCNLVLLAVHSEFDLLNTVERVEMAEVKCVTFYEPDDGLGYTAACTEPITGLNRRLFRRIPLWRAHDQIEFSRVPTETKEDTVDV